MNGRLLRAVPPHCGGPRRYLPFKELYFAVYGVLGTLCTLWLRAFEAVLVTGHGLPHGRLRLKVAYVYCLQRLRAVISFVAGFVERCRGSSQ